MSILAEQEQFTGEAPGRLDFLGGVADYSGSMVLETPIRDVAKVQIERLPARVFQFHADGFSPSEIDAEPILVALNSGASLKELKENVRQRAPEKWTHYPLGCLIVLARAKGWRPPIGLKFQVVSTVPQSMGVSSSAALEIATLHALAQLAQIRFEGTELARLGQQAENHIVGAPCGLMDQLTCAYGTPGLLLPIICRPDELLESVPLPQDMAVVGWPSGIKHAVSDSPYGTARTAAFMGLKIASRVLNRNWNYASEIAPSLFHKKLAKALPETMSGKNFSEEFEGVEDPLCEIVDGRIYPIKAAFSFPILENDRCLRTVDLLRELANKTDEEKLKEIGECLYASHNGYSAMGLGCPETDRMVEAVRKLGPSKGFFGARITGGGSGGTVVVFLKKTALPRLEKLAREIYFTRAKPLSLIY